MLVGNICIFSWQMNHWLISHYSHLTYGQCSFKYIQYQIHDVPQLPEELINHIVDLSHSSHLHWSMTPVSKVKERFLSFDEKLPVVLSFRLSPEVFTPSTWGRALCEVLINVTATQAVRGNSVIQASTMMWQFTFLLSLGTGTDLC